MEPLEVLNLLQRRGNTAAAIEAANHTGSDLLVADAAQVKYVKDRGCGRAVALTQSVKLRSSTRPVLVDLYAVECMVRQARARAEALQVSAELNLAAARSEIQRMEFRILLLLEDYCGVVRQREHLRAQVEDLKGEVQALNGWYNEGGA